MRSTSSVCWSAVTRKAEGVLGVGGDEAGLPGAGPAEAGAGVLDPLEALGDRAVIDGGDGAVDDGAELLGGRDDVPAGHQRPPRPT